MSANAVQPGSNAPTDSDQAQVIARRLNRAFGPVVAGMVIDGIDLATFGPVGLVLGPLVGLIAGYWLGRCLNLQRRESVLCGIAAGIYCSIPFTELLPLGTLVGAYARFRESTPAERDGTEPGQPVPDALPQREIDPRSGEPQGDGAVAQRSDDFTTAASPACLGESL